MTSGRIRIRRSKETHPCGGRAAHGQLVSRTDSSGNRFDFSFNPDGSVARLTSRVAGQATPVEIQDYVYLPATDPKTGKVDRIDIRRGDTTLVRSTTFTHHDGTTAFGTLGDLASMTTLDPAGTLLDSSVYRYTTAPSGQSLIEYTFDTEAVRRATAAGLDLTTAPAPPFSTAVNIRERDALASQPLGDEEQQFGLLFSREDLHGLLDVNEALHGGVVVMAERPDQPRGLHDRNFQSS